MRGVGGFYTVRGADGSLATLRAQGKLRRQHITPMVGDRVRYTPGQGEEHGWLEAVLPRDNALTRPPVANIGRIALVMAAAAPDPDPLLIDRLLIAARMAGIEAMVVINKCDLAPETARALAAQYRGAVSQTLMVSAATGEGVDALREALRGTLHALGGQSGVGKSTLINALYGLSLTTGSVSDRIERGRHTTRHCELLAVPGGGMVLDTPGFSLLETELMEPMRLQEYYPEFLPLNDQCRFSPCAHISEPDCAVRAAVAHGEIDPERHTRYAQLYEEMTLRWRERYD